MKTQGGDSFWMAISVSFFSQLEPASAGGVSPTQLKKYSQVRGEDAKNVKFHHLVSNLKVKTSSWVNFKNRLGKKSPPFPFGSKNFPKKSGVFFKISDFPPSPQPNDSSKKILGAARCFVSPRDPKPTETTHRGFSLPRFSLERRNGRRRFVGVFLFVSPRYRSLHWFNGSHQWPECTKKTSEKVNELFLEIVPLKRTPEKKKNGTAYEWRMDFFGGGPVTWGYIGWGWLFGFASIGADLKGFGDGHVSRMPIFDGSTVIFLLVNKR